jgi:hypothetical protein
VTSDVDDKGHPQQCAQLTAFDRQVSCVARLRNVRDPRLWVGARCLFVVYVWLWAPSTRGSCLGRMKAATVVFYSLFFAVSAAACFAMWLLDQWLAKYTLGAALPPVVLVSEWVEELGRRCKCLTTLGNAHTHTHTQPQQRATKTVLHQSQHPHAPASV